MFWILEDKLVPSCQKGCHRSCPTALAVRAVKTGQAGNKRHRQAGMKH